MTMLVAQLTDTHIKAGGALAYQHVDTAAFLRKAVDHINAFQPTIDAVIVTGDLVDMGRGEEYATTREIFERLTMPYYIVPGNHDHHNNLRAAFHTHAHLQSDETFIQYAIENFPIRLVGLDSTVEGQPHGVLSADRLAWLDETLKAEPQKPTLLFLHHPPFDIGIRHMDAQKLQNANDLFSVLASHTQIRHIACGHAHRPVETSIQGISISIGPNAAHSVTLDLDPDGPSTFTMDPPAIRLFQFSDDGKCISHLSYVGNFTGPLPFYEENGALID